MTMFIRKNVKITESFYYFEDPVNATTSLLRAGVYDPMVIRTNGVQLYCFFNVLVAVAVAVAIVAS